MVSNQASANSLTPEGTKMPLLRSGITLPQVADAKPEGYAIARSMVAISPVQGVPEASQYLEARSKTRVSP